MTAELGNRTHGGARREKDLRRKSFEYIRRLACGVSWCTRPHTWWFGTPSLPHEVQRFVRLTGRRRFVGYGVALFLPRRPPPRSTSPQPTRIDFPRAQIILFPRVHLTHCLYARD